MLKITQNRNIFFIFSGTLIVLGILSLLFWGLSLGIDFTGGSLLEVKITGEPTLIAPQVAAIIQDNIPDMSEIRVQPTEDSSFLIRMKDLDEPTHQQVLSVLKQVPVANENSADLEVASETISPTTYQVEEKRFESIGPVIGQELKNKAVWAISLALVIIILFIAFAFRRVSKPVASWKYGVGAIVALAHDIFIVIGVFSVLNHFFIGFEVDILFITALLTILGYSVNDTIVVYDRIRENLIYDPGATFVETVNKSVNSTISRSINTSLTTLLVLFTLYLFGGSSIQNFVLALMIGTFIGAYSSIFIASPLLVVWHNISRRKK